MKALRLFAWLLFVTGIAYPLFIALLAQGTMRENAQGGIVSINGKAVGAKLIAQKFESEKYFWPRPSAVDYNPLPSGGSNLGPTSAQLRSQVAERKSKLEKGHSGIIPSELLYASGSGLDPHLTPAGAYFQAERVAKARGVEKTKIDELIAAHVEGGIVNVLLLNLALDKLKK